MTSPVASEVAKADAAAPVPPPDPVRIRRRWYLAVAVTVGWIVALAVLAIATANPVALNRLQIDEADVVVVARVMDVEQGVVEVSRSWNHPLDEIPQRLTLDNLARTGAESGREYVLPVSRRLGNAYGVTESRVSRGRPLIYPATPEAIAELEAMLEDLADPPQAAVPTE